MTTMLQWTSGANAPAPRTSGTPPETGTENSQRFAQILQQSAQFQTGQTTEPAMPIWPAMAQQGLSANGEATPQAESAAVKDVRAATAGDLAAADTAEWPAQGVQMPQAELSADAPPQQGTVVAAAAPAQARNVQPESAHAMADERSMIEGAAKAPASQLPAQDGQAPAAAIDAAVPADPRTGQGGFSPALAAEAQAPAAAVLPAATATLAGHQPAAIETLASHQLAAIETLAGHQPAAIETLAGHQPAAIETLAGHQPAAIETLANQPAATQPASETAAVRGLPLRQDAAWVRAEVPVGDALAMAAAAGGETAVDGERGQLLAPVAVAPRALDAGGALSATPLLAAVDSGLSAVGTATASDTGLTSGQNGPTLTLRPEQVAEHIGMQLRDQGNGRHEAQIQLHPAELGRMELELRQDGRQVELNIRVESEQTQRLIQDQINQWRERLQEAGLNLGAVNVSVGDQAERQDSDSEGKHATSGLGESDENPSSGTERHASLSALDLYA